MMLVSIIGGIFGTLLRIFINYLFKKMMMYSTFIVNFMASLCLGYMVSFYGEKHDITYYFFMSMSTTLSTFSTYGLEAYTFLKNKQYKHLFFIVSINHLLCFVAIYSMIELKR